MTFLLKLMSLKLGHDNLLFSCGNGHEGRIRDSGCYYFMQVQIKRKGTRVELSLVSWGLDGPTAQHLVQVLQKLLLLSDAVQHRTTLVHSNSAAAAVAVLLR